ncbi:MAG: hypothetical protein LC127_09835, partial [Chitinophagales bacterium]|nr:hypothetical protein [Chitinophagales bacterium]
FYMVETEDDVWDHNYLVSGLAYKMREIKFDFIVALDDFDVEHVAFVREYFRISGMGETTARYFRDKLAMRVKAESEGVPVPAFTALFNDADIHDYTQRVPPPWMVKPRMQASAAGIKKIYSAEELWSHLEYLGGERHEYLLEKFAPGDVYHVDSLNTDGKVVFTRVGQYLDTPFEVAHGGGIFRSVTVEHDSQEAKDLEKLNADVMKAFGMNYSASHSEFIKNREDGKYYFIETSSRVGGAHIAEMVEFSSGINLWWEWARIELAACRKEKYKLPKQKKEYGGVMISLSKYEYPDMSSFNDPEVVWKMHKKYHVGLIVHSKQRERVLELMDKYAEIIHHEFHAAAPAKEKFRGHGDS